MICDDTFSLDCMQVQWPNGLKFCFCNFFEDMLLCSSMEFCIWCNDTYSHNSLLFGSKNVMNNEIKEETHILQISVTQHEIIRTCVSINGRKEMFY